MITLFTGLPGAGKTLFAIKHVAEQFKDRPVYVCGIRELNVPEWEEVTHEDVLNDWWNYPEGSVFLVDECQDLWRPRSATKEVPPSIIKLEKNRHLGFDFVLTCQYPLQIDKGLRELVNFHYHLYRPFGAKVTNKYYWEGCITDTDNKTKLKNAQTSVVKFDKKYFDYYKSAEIHTVKFRPPKILYIAFAILIFALFSLYRFTNGFVNPEEQELSSNERPASVSDLKIYKSDTLEEGDDIVSYLKFRTPRIDNVPDSAPIYDEVQAVVSKPRLQCLFKHEDGLSQLNCRCYTQQATRLSIDPDYCLSFVARGRQFDPSIPDYFQNNQRQDKVASESGASAQLTATESYPPFDLIQKKQVVSSPVFTPDSVPYP